jgi:hypothetical protein
MSALNLIDPLSQIICSWDINPASIYGGRRQGDELFYTESTFRIAV